MPEMQQVVSRTTETTSSGTSPGDPFAPQSVPPWVHANETHEASPFSRPPPARPNTRHYKPPPPGPPPPPRPPAHYKVGRKWDHFRSDEPALLSAPIAEHQLRWGPFMRSGPNPRENTAQSRLVSREWMVENMPVVMRGWQESDEINPEAAGRPPGGFQGVMYRGKWLISPERQERTVKLFWVSVYLHVYRPRTRRDRSASKVPPWSPRVGYGRARYSSRNFITFGRTDMRNRDYFSRMPLYLWLCV